MSLRSPRLLPLVGLGLALTLAGVGCSRCESDDSARGEPGAAGLSAERQRPQRQLTVGIPQEPESLWPAFYTMMAAEEVLGAGQVSLTVFDDKGQLQPSAAVQIPDEKNGGLVFLDDGGMRVTWDLDKNLAWPDGTPLTALDFIFAQQVLGDPRYKLGQTQVSALIRDMRAQGPDQRQLVVTWKQQYPYYANYNIHPVLPKHLLEQRYQQNPDALLDDAYGRLPALPGSFTVSEWIRGSHIILQRNPSVRGRWVPWFDRIIFRIIPSTSALEANLLSGTIDAISGGWLPQDRVVALREKHAKDFDFHFIEGLLFEHIDCKLDNPILADLRVRRALLHGVDRGKILRDLFGAQQAVAHSWLPPRRPEHNPAVHRYDFDPQRAAELLDEAGWRLGATGLREKEGQQLRLSITAPSGNSTRERIEQQLQQAWAKLGVQLDIENQPATLFFQETLRERKFSGLAMYAWALDPLTDSGDLWRCDRIPSQDNGLRGQNYPGWCNQEVTGLHQDITHEFDPERRKALLMRQQLLWAEALPVLPLYFKVEPSITVKRLRGWKPTGNAMPVSWNAAEWRYAD